jgi:ribonuclease HI
MHHPSTYHISYIDGPIHWIHNLAWAAWTLYTPSHVLLHSNGICLGLTTNNQAEYDVVIGLVVEASHCHICHLSILLDSHLFILQLNNVYHVHDPCLCHKYLQVRLLLSQLCFHHIYTYSKNPQSSSRSND